MSNNHYYKILGPVLILLIPPPLYMSKPQGGAPLPVPVISVGKESLSGFGIANNMKRFFQEGGTPPKKEEVEDEDDCTFIGDEVRS